LQKVKKPKDEELLSGIRDGSDVIIKFIYRKNLPVITSYITSNSGTPSDAEDIFQEALIIIYEKLRDEQLELKSSLATYIYSICKNLWLKVLRRKSSGFLPLEGDFFVSDENLIEAIEQSEKYSLYRKYFQKLDVSCRQVISLFIAGSKTEEVMSITGFSNSHVRKKRFDCKKKLIELIEKDPAFQEHLYTSIK